MASNLPPGVHDSDIPGNRPQDENVVIELSLSKGEIWALKSYTDADDSLNDRNDRWIMRDVFDQITSTPID